MKHDNNFICDNKRCKKVIKHIPVSYLSLQKEHFCNLKCKFESEGKMFTKMYMLSEDQKDRYAERRRKIGAGIAMKARSKWGK